MLTLNGEPFTTGVSRYADGPHGRAEHAAKIFVKVQVGEALMLAELDTGAQWSVIDPEVGETLGLDERDGIGVSAYRTAYGRFAGRLHKIAVQLVADEGASLQLEATFFMPTRDGWPAGRTYLGYSSLLDSIRFDVDPGQNRFHFGQSDTSGAPAATPVLPQGPI